jgi:serine/threonine protein kinase
VQLLTTTIVCFSCCTRVRSALVLRVYLSDLWRRHGQHYADLTCIGSGKFATVHRAQHRPSGTSVALKKVQVFTDIIESAERHEVVREAKLLQKVGPASISPALRCAIEYPYISKRIRETVDEGESVLRQEASMQAVDASGARLPQVDHIHIIKCYDSWIEDGEFYVCLELCDKGDLGSLIKQVCSKRLESTRGGQE